MTDYLSQIEAMMNRVAELRATYFTPEDESSRTPGTISTWSNAADKIERHLRADGHRVWGFVLYRCTYDNDADWELCMQRINEAIQQNMETWNGFDLLGEGCFKFTVIEDKTEFYGASKSAVRQRFREWCTRALHEEQGSSEEIERRRQEPMPWCGSLAVRYRFCLQIDEASLQSIVSDEHDAWVNLIRDDWQLLEVARQEKAQQDAENQGLVDDDEGDFTDDELDEEYPAIEGCTDEDVGWMKVEYRYLMPTFYSQLRHLNGWYVSYCRPPDVASV